MGTIAIVRSTSRSSRAPSTLRAQSRSGWAGFVASFAREFHAAPAWMWFIFAAYRSHVSRSDSGVHASLMYLVRRLGATPPAYGWRAIVGFLGAFVGSVGGTYVPAAIARRRWRSFFPSFFFFAPDDAEAGGASSWDGEGRAEAGTATASEGATGGSRAGSAPAPTGGGGGIAARRA